MYRRRRNGRGGAGGAGGPRGEAFEVLLVHPGGPFWANRDEGAWTLPKGEFDPQREGALAAAVREFREETGLEPPAADEAQRFIALGEVRQRGGKVVRAWAFEGDCDPHALRSNTFRCRWPPRSGQWRTFPEVDAYGWFDPVSAKVKINPAQVAFIDRLAEALAQR